MKYLLIANIVVWGGLLLYIFFISNRQKELEKKLKILEKQRDSHERKKF